MNVLKLKTIEAPLILTVHSTEESVLHVVPAQYLDLKILGKPGIPGLTGPEGPDPWAEPIQVISASGAVTLDYALGKYVRLTLTADVTSLSVINWPATGHISRLTLEILNDGSFDILSWPANTHWQSGVPPALTMGAGGKDRLILSTTDGGGVIYGDPVGFDYRTP